MLKTKLTITFIAVMFVLCFVFIIPREKTHKIIGIKSPTEIVLDNGELKIKDLDCFDGFYSDKNSKLSKKLGISEDEAFILGNLGKYWAENLVKNRRVYIDDNSDFRYNKYSYKTKFYYSGYCLRDGEPCYKEGFENRLSGVRKGEYKVLDLDSNNVYQPSYSNVKNLKNYLVIRKYHLPKKVLNPIFPIDKARILDIGDIKIYFSDLTSKLKPDRTCSSDICKVILKNINKANKSIDIAIYGYSRVPEIETALNNAIKRGVKLRLVYDLNQKGENIYPDTNII